MGAALPRVWWTSKDQPYPGESDTACSLRRRAGAETFLTTEQRKDWIARWHHDFAITCTTGATFFTRSP